MSLPRATMRLQFHCGFTFAQAASLAPYFASLGISHIYSSPIMTARPGSLHGYDTIDATRVNAELGGEEGLRRLVHELRRHDLGLIVDIVPNHMAVGRGNVWWMDVLARGRDSRYAKYFDIDWSPTDPSLRGKVLLPILGRPYGMALAAGEIALSLDEARQPVVRYFDQAFPLSAECTDALDRDSLAEIGAGSVAGLQRLHAVLERQHYRLVWWRSANDRINWRRFFDVNELAAVRVEDDEVFEAVHAALFRLYAAGLIDGVRIDHVDGLSLPGRYCRQLRARLHALERQRPPDCPTGPAYFVVEKILAHDEQLPKSWETDGTTGYDFMNEISLLQHDSAGEQPLNSLWQRISGRTDDFKTEEERSRRTVLQLSFASQLETVIDTLCEMSQGDLTTKDISRAALRRSVTEILAQFPVYRTYTQVGDSSQADVAAVLQAVSRAAKSCLPGDRWLVELLARWLIGERIRTDTEALQGTALTRFQQLSAPLSAKGAEDTAFYRYGRLISRNDVGFDPGRLACSAAEFHDRMLMRQRDFPHALLATATHDHKRGEDVRARLAVLSEIAEEWGDKLERWIALSAEQFAATVGGPIPDAVDRAMLFQTLVGAWPMDLQTADQANMKEFAKRITAWQQKSLREAKLHSDWSTPNEAYERAAEGFVSWLFATPMMLLIEIAGFARRVAPAGAVNSLAQVVTKLTAPGVPDMYQGTEYWDFSLVDPDNRAPVDFAARQRLPAASAIASMVENWTDGRIKQFVIARILAARKKTPEVYAEGDYMPLQTTGPLARHVIAFARVLPGATAITLMCQHPARLLGGERAIAIAKDNWKDTRILMPPDIQSAELVDVLSGAEIRASGTALEAAQVFAGMPVALLAAQAS
jgi:(1->4)-alpha-D-glucan 1-alpha-D-glucosylmutase